MPLPTTLLTKKNDIEYWEFDGYRESWRENATAVTRILQCYWDERQDFLYEMLGGSYVQGSTLNRDIPERHPEYEDFWAIGADLPKGLGVLHHSGTEYGMVSYRHRVPGSLDGSEPDEGSDGYAIYEVSYSPVPWTVLDDDSLPANGLEELNRYLIRDLQPGAEELPMNGIQIVFVEGPFQGQPLGPAGLVVPKPNLAYLWKQVPEIPPNLLGMLGKMNSAKFDDKYDPRTLFMHAPTITRYTTAYGYFAYDILFNFSYDPNRHDKKLAGLNFYRVAREGDTSNSIYFEDDFLNAFRF